MFRSEANEAYMTLLHITIQLSRGLAPSGPGELVHRDIANTICCNLVALRNSSASMYDIYVCTMNSILFAPERLLDIYIYISRS